MAALVSASRSFLATLQKGGLKGKKGMLVLAYQERIEGGTQWNMEEKKGKKKQLYFNDCKLVFVSKTLAKALPPSGPIWFNPMLQKGGLKGKKGMLVPAYQKRIEGHPYWNVGKKRDFFFGIVLQ